MPRDNSAPNVGITSDEQIRNVLHRHIKRALDRREFSRASLAKESGVELFQIDQINSSDKAKHRRVTCEDAFNIAYTLGDDCVTALLGVIHYTARRIDADEVDAHHIVASALPHMATIASAAADGRFDHTERPAVQEAADHLVATFLPLSSAGGMQ
ncbi:hypothetical protein Saro_3011 [Novosphingobium aromaticivorans DSM 12444]|uniref:Uncharacterized protein n=1 Tax=Novosphingobium aromaticivorans (strain ATCC 700278 / DSM 12444 / CCUG 56034 / CIP 105152 / NBRC 16084 / F199) TaxID=279238 RepID=Q2G3X7_NOVAD|nr:hypothetical protein [Novosphingobium aromaticivorans]ABD27446.1 hypothetical protein Saro_3011 [Novosphingobium aromaticivorans DSM 12444]SCY69562.1 hypothetical protein SAMN05660666_02521 [Novosphingobium aromaticivorans]